MSRTTSATRRLSQAGGSETGWVFAPDVYAAARVRAAFRAAADRSAGPLVRAAFFAAADRWAAVRRRAADRACFDSDARDAALRPSRLRARLIARDRLADGARGARLPWPASQARSAPSRVRWLVFPGAGGGRSTPARRASERPIAIACLADRAPCSPRRIL